MEIEYLYVVLVAARKMDSCVDIVANLKPVFDSCDISGDGFVIIDDLLQLGKQHAFENLEVLFQSFLFYVIV